MTQLEQLYEKERLSMQSKSKGNDLKRANLY